LSGSASHSAGVFTVSAAGTGIAGSTDQFHFVYQPVTGDADITARVDSLTAANAWSKAGVMIRASLSADAAHALTFVSAAKGIHYRRRRQTGGRSRTTTPSSGVRAPVWVRLVREGNRVTSYWSTGTAWTEIRSIEIALGATAYYGIAVSSRDPDVRTTARVSNVVVSRPGLPAGQRSTDIGAPAISGDVAFSGGKYTIRAGGADIWGTADQFHFVYQPFTGDGEVRARVSSLVHTHDWAKAGVMIRDALTPESRHAMVVLSAGRGFSFQRRRDAGGISDRTSGGSGTAPGWVRLVRRGDLFEAYRSSDGSAWTRFASDTIAMGATVYIGLAATSRNTSAATTAIVDNLEITGGASGDRPPIVSITAPPTGSKFTAPATITISADATDPEGRMASVDFYAEGTLIARDTTEPYSAAWTVSSPGTYVLTATAHDADGGSTTSSAVTVTVSANSPPTVTLTSPTGGASYTAPATITVSANASDPEGRMARVEFFSGSTRLATDTSAPYSYTWTDVPEGSYNLRAVAYDDAGASGTSATVTVTVASAAGPPRWVAFTASADHSTTVTSYLFEVFASGANPETATPVATSNLGKPTPDASNEIMVDRATFFSGLAVGSYVATVSAIGTAGNARSESVTFTR
jgi:regulation of enolase protein 1 (concanavalin A-like superfamily)